MKTLVTYYSRTGITKKIAIEIAKQTNAEIDEIIDLKNRFGKLNFLKACKDGLQEKETKIKYTQNPSKFDLIIIGTPVWAGNMTPAIRTYFKENKPQKCAFFCTCGNNEDKTLINLNKMSNGIADLCLNTKEINNNFNSKINDFMDKIKKTL